MYGGFQGGSFLSPQCWERGQYLSDGCTSCDRCCFSRPDRVRALVNSVPGIFIQSRSFICSRWYLFLNSFICRRTGIIYTYVYIYLLHQLLLFTFWTLFRLLWDQTESKVWSKNKRITERKFSPLHFAEWFFSLGLLQFWCRYIQLKQSYMHLTWLECFFFLLCMKCNF